MIVDHPQIQSHREQKKEKKKEQDIKRYQQKHSAPKGEGARTFNNTSPRKTMPMVSSKQKTSGKGGYGKRSTK
jgi:hypothetical protein